MLAPAGAREITLNPEIVMAYAVVPAESTTIIRGLVLNLVVPKTLTTGFSGTGPTSDTAPAFRSIICRVVRESSRVAVVMFWRTGVVSHRNEWSFNGATAATLRLPVLTMVAVGGAPPAAARRDRGGARRGRAAQGGQRSIQNQAVHQEVVGSQTSAPAHRNSP